MKIQTLFRNDDVRYLVLILPPYRINEYRPRITHHWLQCIAYFNLYLYLKSSFDLHIHSSFLFGNVTCELIKGESNIINQAPINWLNRYSMKMSLVAVAARKGTVPVASEVGTSARWMPGDGSQFGSHLFHGELSSQADCGIHFSWQSAHALLFLRKSPRNTHE